MVLLKNTAATFTFLRYLTLLHGFINPAFLKKSLAAARRREKIESLLHGREKPQKKEMRGKVF